MRGDRGASEQAVARSDTWADAERRGIVSHANVARIDPPALTSCSTGESPLDLRNAAP